MENEKTVYAVIGGEYEDRYIVDIYDKKEDADLAAKIENFYDCGEVVEATLKSKPPATTRTYLARGHMEGYIDGCTINCNDFSLNFELDDKIKLDDGVEMGEPEFTKETGYFNYRSGWVFRVHANVRYDVNEDIKVFKKRLQVKLRDKFRVWIRSQVGMEEE